MGLAQYKLYEDFGSRKSNGLFLQISAFFRLVFPIHQEGKNFSYLLEKGQNGLSIIQTIVINIQGTPARCQWR